MRVSVCGDLKTGEQGNSLGVFSFLLLRLCVCVIHCVILSISALSPFWRMSLGEEG